MGGQKGGCLHHPWPGQDQDKEETSNESRQEDDVRPGSRRQSKACQDCRQGIPNSCTQERYLILLCKTSPRNRSSCGKFYIEVRYFRQAGSVRVWQQMPLYMAQQLGPVCIEK